MFGLFKRSKATNIFVEPGVATEDFNPAPRKPCFCGSGKTFAECCGAKLIIRNPPFGVFVFENYLDQDYVKQLRAFADQREGHPLMMIDNEKSTPDNIVKITDQRRITERVDLGNRRQEINDLVKSIYVKLADKCFAKKLDWIETPDLMRYQPGGHYLRHADSENMDPATQTWKKVIDRDISLLIYLNDDFEGGELTFTKFNYKLRPTPGTVVLFPSDHRYLHQAEVVKSGVRYAIVSWSSISGMQKIAKKPPACAIPVELNFDTH